MYPLMSAPYAIKEEFCTSLPLNFAKVPASSNSIHSRATCQLSDKVTDRFFHPPVSLYHNLSASRTKIFFPLSYLVPFLSVPSSFTLSASVLTDFPYPVFLSRKRAAGDT
jgi:hypothetical protein